MRYNSIINVKRWDVEKEVNELLRRHYVTVEAEDKREAGGSFKPCWVLVISA